MKQREIWLLNLDPAIGVEIRKTRPCVILSNDDIGILPLKVIAPLTDFKAHYQTVPWMVKVVPSRANGLQKASAVDTFQVRSVAAARFVKKIGCVSEEELAKIKAALQVVFDIG